VTTQERDARSRPVRIANLLVHKVRARPFPARRIRQADGMAQSLRLARGCHVPATQLTFADRCAALLMANPPETVLAGIAAATLHGLWLPDRPVVPEFATSQTGRRAAQMARARKPEFRTHRRQIPEQQRTLANGIPVTSLARTWWDLAAELTLPDLVAASDRALQLGCRREDIAQLLRGMVRRRGNALARRAVPLLNARSRSRPESHLRVAVRQAGLDCFEVNEPITDDHGGWLAEPDLSCREARIALEYQGLDHAEVGRMRRDITRLTDLRRHGWLVLLYGPAQVFGHPWQIAPELRQLIGQRAPELLRRQPASAD
jgi:very-short-patch-repair endonuclease